MGFMNHGVKLEQSLGSSYFAVLFFTLTIATNVLFLAIEILLWGLTNNEAHLLSASMGIWVVLLGIIAAECAQAPPDTIKKLFFLEVKAVYYPMGTSSSWAVYGCNESDVQLPVLLGLFSLLGGPRLSYCLGVAVGYGYGYGKLDRFKVRVERVRSEVRRKHISVSSSYNISLGEEMGKSRPKWILEWIRTPTWVYNVSLASLPFLCQHPGLNNCEALGPRPAPWHGKKVQVEGGATMQVQAALPGQCEHQKTPAPQAFPAQVEDPLVDRGAAYCQDHPKRRRRRGLHYSKELQKGEGTNKKENCRCKSGIVRLFFRAVSWLE